MTKPARLRHRSDPPATIDGQAYLTLAPKAELHLHLEGSLEPESILAGYRRNGIATRFESAEALRNAFRFDSFKSFVNAFMFSALSLRKPADFYGAVLELGAALQQQNVLYAEVTWTPQIHRRENLDCTTILMAMNEAAERVEREGGPELFWIPDLIRSAPQQAARTIEWLNTLNLPESRIAALGLGGPEAGYPASRLRNHFLAAQRMGLPANPHAGEGDGATSIWETIQHLQPRRLGHGVRAFEDPKLMHYLAKSGIAIEVCVTSNVLLGVFASEQQHPIRTLMQQGVCVTLNSDDPGLFQSTLTAEYQKAHSQCGLTIAELKQILLNGFMHAYLSPERRSHYLRRVSQSLDELDARCPETTFGTE